MPDKMKPIHLELPWPPSVNDYWKTRRNGGTYLSHDGREYREAVDKIVSIAGVDQVECNVSVFMDAHPPNRRKRDLDNLFKALFDALQHGGVVADDAQVKRVVAEMRDDALDRPLGRISLKIEEYARAAA